MDDQGSDSHPGRRQGRDIRHRGRADRGPAGRRGRLESASHSRRRRWPLEQHRRRDAPEGPLHPEGTGGGSRRERAIHAEPVETGDPASRTLPLRIATRLDRRQAASGSALATPRASGATARCCGSTRARASVGTIPLSGRLTMPGGNPLAGADVEVWERTKLPSADWRRVSVLRTSRTGRFRFKALRGPSRTLRFRFPGTATIRSRSTEVDLGVRASTSFRASRSSRRQRRGGPFPRSPSRAPGRRYRQALATCRCTRVAAGRPSRHLAPTAPAASGASPTGSARRAVSSATGSACLIPRETTFPYETGHSRTAEGHGPRALIRNSGARERMFRHMSRIRSHSPTPT